MDVVMLDGNIQLRILCEFDDDAAGELTEELPVLFVYADHFRGGRDFRLRTLEITHDEPELIDDPSDRSPAESPERKATRTPGNIANSMGPALTDLPPRTSIHSFRCASGSGVTTCRCPIDTPDEFSGKTWADAHDIPAAIRTSVFIGVIISHDPCSYCFS